MVRDIQATIMERFWGADEIIVSKADPSGDYSPERRMQIHKAFRKTGV